MEKDERCPVCGAGRVTLERTTSPVDYHGKQGSVVTLFKRCDTCGSEFADAEVSRLNKRAVLAFRKSVDGLLRGDEIRALRERFHLSQKQAAQLFGGGPVAFSKYENDDVVQSEAMDTLLRLVLSDKETLRRLIVQRGLQADFAGLCVDDAHSAKIIAGRYEFGGFEVISADFGAGTWARRPPETRPYASRATVCRMN